MVADHFVDDEAQEFLAEFGVELALLGQPAQAGDLLLLSRGIGRRQCYLRLVFAHRLRDPEAFGQHVDERCIDIVDAFAETGEDAIGLVG